MPDMFTRSIVRDVLVYTEISMLQDTLCLMQEIEPDPKQESRSK